MSKWRKARRKGSCWCCGRSLGNGKSDDKLKHWRKDGVARRYKQTMRRRMVEDAAPAR